MIAERGSEFIVTTHQRSKNGAGGGLGNRFGSDDDINLDEIPNTNTKDGGEE